jgi:signal transduction histidine kinase
MSFSKSFARQPRAWIVAEVAASIGMIAMLDLMTSYRIRLLPLYAVPIFVLGWFCGKRWGVAGALFSGVIWWYVNWCSGDPDLHGAIAVWEVPRHVGFFLLVALVGSVLRTRSDIAAERIALLEHSHRLEGEIVNISEAEQRRIGQDLHDGLCQYLAGLTCSASSIRDDLQELHLTANANAADELVKLLQDAVVQTRDLARRLVPAHVSRLGLVLALESLAQSVTRLHGISCRFCCNANSGNWDEHTATHLYRIAQEGINNATRHANARNIFVFLDGVDRSVTLRVEDDGTGISDSNSEGMGLDIMRYRARLIGGELTIERRNGRGTAISCTVTSTSQDNEIPGDEID